MSPRWSASRQSAWGGASKESSSGYTKLIGLALIVFVLGAAVGYGAGHKGSGTADAATANADVVDPVLPDLAMVKSAPKNERGAVKAATALYSGLPNLAKQTASDRQTTAQSLLAPDASSTQYSNLVTILSQQSTALQRPGPPAAVFPAPVTYKVTMQGEDRATVEVWGMLVVANPASNNGAIFDSQWSTHTFQLHYTDSWRVVSWTTKEGPNPQLAGTKYTKYEEAQPQLNGAWAYRYALSR